MPGGWTLEQVAQEIRKNANKRVPVRTVLLAGAGSSYQAGIPLARGFVDDIKARFPEEYERAAEKTYPICMGELSASDRHDLISEYIDKAKINWAHISIAQLMRAGYVDRVLTTNFDPLVTRACALLNFYPAVYDMAVVRRGFVADYVRDQAVFHLHGQRDGFVQLHRKDEVDALAEAIEPLFDDTARNRCWIVIGYSGANDPVFRALADRPDFPNRLFWVGFRDEQPSAAVKAALLDAGKDVHWISGYDPDTFLLQLASRLGCFPPGFFAKPFTHLLECFGSLAGFRLPGQDQDLDWAARARGWIEQAIKTFEAVPAAVAGGAAPPAPGEVTRDFAPAAGVESATARSAPRAPAAAAPAASPPADAPAPPPPPPAPAPSAPAPAAPAAVREPAAFLIPLEERQFGVRLGIIHDRSLLESAAFVLVVSADINSEVLARTFRAQINAGPVEKLRELVMLALPGVPLRPLLVAPRQLPPNSSAVYFEFDTSSELWPEVVRSGHLAVHLAGSFPNLRMELWAIKREDVISVAWTAMMAGQYDQVIALAPFYDSGEVPELAEPLAWSLAASAKEMAERAKGAGDAERQQLESKAHEYARRADVIRPGLGATVLEPHAE